jgi:hypothetical protein
VADGATFDSLLVFYTKDGRFQYAGRVREGSTARTRAALTWRLLPHGLRDQCPVRRLAARRFLPHAASVKPARHGRRHAGLAVAAVRRGDRSGVSRLGATRPLTARAVPRHPRGQVSVSSNRIGRAPVGLRESPGRAALPRGRPRTVHFSPVRVPFSQRHADDLHEMT